MYLSNGYIKEVSRQTSITKSSIAILSLIFFACTSNMGAIDLGAFGTIVITVSAILVLYPVYLRDTYTNKGETNIASTPTMLLIVIVYTLGLYVTPAASVLPGLEESGGHLTVYALIALGSVLSATTLSHIYVETSSEPEPNSNCYRGHRSSDRKKALRRR